MEVGFGKEAQRADTCDVAYEVFTQGGLYLDSVGFGMVHVDPHASIQLRHPLHRESPPAVGWRRSHAGQPAAVLTPQESKKDIGETVRITLDDSVPIAIRNAMRGMREGGKRRIVVPPKLGYVSHNAQCHQPTFHDATLCFMWAMHGRVPAACKCEMHPW
jgi:FKBP-type peptidyl-prolyl cis-trans isomerase